VEPDLLETYRLVFRADLPRCPVGGPTPNGEKPAKGIVGCVHPAAGMLEAISAQRVGARVQQSGSVALVLSRWIHDELINRTVLAALGIFVLTGHGGSEPDDSLAVSSSKNPEGGLGWSLDSSPPGVDHAGQRHRGEHQLCQLGRPLDGPGAALEHRNV